eukprot:7338414-Prymnesium_polylepis.1
MCAVNGRVLLHGGTGYREEPTYPNEAFCFLVNNILPSRLTGRRVLLSDLHILEPATCRWSQPELGGWAPTKRAFHSLVPLDGRVLVFGGRGGSKGRAATDVALLDLTPRTEAAGDGYWTHPQLAETRAHVSRAYAGAAAVGGRLM